MIPLHKDQLKLSFRQYYHKNNNTFVNVDQLKRANILLTKKNPTRESQKLFSYFIRNNKQPHEAFTDQYVHYEALQQRVDQCLNEQQKHDQTMVDLLFQLLDQDKDGLLNLYDFIHFLASIGSTIEQKEIIDLLEMITPEGTSLTKKQFLLIFQRM